MALKILLIFCGTLVSVQASNDITLIKLMHKGAGLLVWLECDGTIYSVVNKLIFNVLFCSKCDTFFYGKHTFEEHRCFVLHAVVPQYEFDWIVLSLGILHIEMNACKASFEINWNVFMKDI